MLMKMKNKEKIIDSQQYIKHLKLSTTTYCLLLLFVLIIIPYLLSMFHVIYLPQHIHAGKEDQCDEQSNNAIETDTMW